jgi:hypothetical protein
MFSTSPETEKWLGLGGQRRTFDFIDKLIEALELANLGADSLKAIVNELERGNPQQLELSDEQATAIGMLPHRGQDV